VLVMVVGSRYIGRSESGNGKAVPPLLPLGQGFFVTGTGASSARRHSGTSGFDNRAEVCQPSHRDDVTQLSDNSHRTEAEKDTSKIVGRKSKHVPRNVGGLPEGLAGRARSYKRKKTSGE
jgi:hypothetical protein